MSAHEMHVLINWLRVFLIAAVVFADLFVVLYAFSPWYRSAVGRLLMLQSISLALALDITLVFHFWPPHSIMVAFWIELFEFLLIALASCCLCVLLIVYYTRTLRRRHQDRVIT
jgi:hypothetical protein